MTTTPSKQCPDEGSKCKVCMYLKVFKIATRVGKKDMNFRRCMLTGKNLPIEEDL